MKKVFFLILSVGLFNTNSMAWWLNKVDLVAVGQQVSTTKVFIRNNEGRYYNFALTADSLKEKTALALTALSAGKKVTLNLTDSNQVQEIYIYQ